MFRIGFPPQDCRRYESLFQSESQRVVIDMLAFDPFSWRPRASLRVLVLGAADDAFLIPAKSKPPPAFGTTATIFPDMAMA